MARLKHSTTLTGHSTRPYQEYSRSDDRGQSDMPMGAERRLNMKNDFDLVCMHVDGDGDPDGDVCYGPCGVIQLGAVAVIVDASGSPDAPLPTEQRQLFLFAPEGFVQVGGVWRQIEHAAKNPGYGRRPTYRRPVRSSANGATYHLPPAEFPYVVRCPWCGNVRTLRDRDGLQLIVEK